MKQRIQNNINHHLNHAQTVFRQTDAFKTIRIEDFNCSDLTPPVQTNGKNLPNKILETFFQPLHTFDELEGSINDYPCLYVFELANSSDIERTWQRFETLARNNNTNRILPSFKKCEKTSNVLYIGKVDRGVGGRLVTHMGYYDKPGNHGLQLAFWAREMSPSLILNVTVLRFKQDFRPYLEVFEKQMAASFNPLIGKHR